MAEIKWSADKTLQDFVAEWNTLSPQLDNNDSNVQLLRENVNALTVNQTKSKSEKIHMMVAFIELAKRLLKNQNKQGEGKISIKVHRLI